MNKKKSPQCCKIWCATLTDNTGGKNRYITNPPKIATVHATRCRQLQDSHLECKRANLYAQTFHHNKLSGPVPIGPRKTSDPAALQQKNGHLCERMRACVHVCVR